jgi:hypothetical protein
MVTMIDFVQGMKQRTVRIDIEPPLSQIKSRIDEIYSVIEKHAFVEPMLSDGARRALVADSILNIDRNAQKIYTSEKVPDLSVTNVKPEYVGKMARQVPSSILRGEARIAVALEQEARNRLERRKLLHRNCTETAQQASRTDVISQQRQIQRRSPTRAMMDKHNIEASNSPIKSPCTKISQKVTVQECAGPPTGPPLLPSPLDQLVHETNELLGAEDCEYELVHDDIISEIERDIEQLI